MRRGGAFLALVALALSFAVPFHALASRSQTTGNSGQFVGSAPVTATPLTMAIWFRSATATTAEQSMFSIQSGSSPGHFFLLDGRGDTAGNALQAYAAAGPAGAATTTSALADNTWHHCLGTFASSTSRSAFLDGTGRGNGSTDITPSGIDRVSVGTVGAQGVDVAGTVAYAAIWNYDLEVGAIESLAAGQNPLFAAHSDQLVFYAPLDGSGSIEADVVGQRALTVGNGVVAETRPGMVLR